MSAILLMAVGLGTFAVGYMFYSRFISERVFQLSSDFETPAHALEDGVD
jgi:carbon starvation protein